MEQSDLYRDVPIQLPGKDEMAVRLAKTFAVPHATYFGMNYPNHVGTAIVALSTYPKSWHKRYLEQRYAEIDPVVNVARRRLLPLDWREIDRDNNVVKRFFGEAVEHGIHENGLTLPIRGAYGEFALVTVNGQLENGTWQRFKSSKLPELYVQAYELHNQVMSAFTPPPEDVCLTPRQHEVLFWASEGKTMWETAKICGIGERTVKFHIHQAIRALSVYSKTQAVAKATRLGLI